MLKEDEMGFISMCLLHTLKDATNWYLAIAGLFWLLLFFLLGGTLENSVRFLFRSCTKFILSLILIPESMMDGSFFQASSLFCGIFSESSILIKQRIGSERVQTFHMMHKITREYSILKRIELFRKIRGIVWSLFSKAECHKWLMFSDSAEKLFILNTQFLEKFSCLELRIFAESSVGLFKY